MAKQGLMDEAGYEPVVDEIAFDDGFKKGVEIHGCLSLCHPPVLCHIPRGSSSPADSLYTGKLS